jgi:cytochrome c peroxidase
LFVLKRAAAYSCFSLAAFSQVSFEWSILQSFPRPVVPEDNPMAAAKVELGRHLFYDQRMFVNGKLPRSRDSI